MRRKAAVLVTTTAITVAAGVIGAAPASAGNGPNPHSQHGQCTSAANGLHKGWDKQGSTERRNVGGNCPAQ